MRKKFLTLWLTEDPQHGSEIRDSEPAGQTVTRPTDKQGRNMPFRGFLQLFGFKKKKETAKPPRQHPYDEVNEADIKDNQSAPKRRPREYDEIEIDDDGSGPSVVAESSTKPETKTLNYIEVEVQQQNPDADVKRAAPPTQYTTIDVAATSAASGRKISLSE